MLPKVAVTLTNRDTGVAAKAATDQNGNFDFFDVKAGRYTIAGEAAGFSRMSTTGVTVNVRAHQRVGRQTSGIVRTDGRQPSLRIIANAGAVQSGGPIFSGSLLIFKAWLPEQRVH